MIDEQKCGSKQERKRRKGKKEQKIWKENGIWIFGANSYSSMLFRYFFSSSVYVCLSLFFCTLERIGSVLLRIASVAHVYIFHYMRYVYTNVASHFGIYISEPETLTERDSFSLFVSHFFVGSLLRSVDGFIGV